MPVRICVNWAPQSIKNPEDSSDANEDWDLVDFVSFEYQIDGGGRTNLLAIESIPDGDSFNAVPALDTDFDGDGDGTEITEVARHLWSEPINGSIPNNS